VFFKKAPKNVIFRKTPKIDFPTRFGVFLTKSIKKQQKNVKKTSFLAHFWLFLRFPEAYGGFQKCHFSTILRLKTLKFRPKSTIFCLLFCLFFTPPKNDPQKKG
jgi:hypothetical protein